MAKTVILLIGPCSAGKTVILEMMLESEHKVGVIKTTSTRPLRENDYLCGISTYESVSEQEFLGMIESGDMVRYMQYDNNYYGMRKRAVFNALEDSDIVVIGVNEVSVKEYKDWLISEGIECVFCFVSPRPLRGIPDLVNNLAELKSRMRHSRPDLDEDQIQRRFESAQSCLTWMLENQSLADYKVVTWDRDYRATRLEAITLVSSYSL